MKTLLYFFTIIFLITISSITKISAQESENVRKKLMHNHYRAVLQIDSLKAEQIARIHNDYKTEIKKLMADTNISDTVKRTKIDLLIRNKNQKMRSLLSPEQQKKIIPTTELKKEL